MDIAAWLRALGLEQYAPAFRDNDIDARVLPGLTAEDLREIGITSVGHRRLLLQAIAALQEPPASAVGPAMGAAAHVAAPAAAAPPQPERRQLTVMLVDLVGSTALSARLDPEEMREVIRAYQNAVAGEITRFEGHIAKYMGDGVLCYFGYPKAHEDDAERAVRAGLALVDAVKRLMPRDGVALQVRVGIATGLVVVGDLTGEGAVREEAVVGETPNLAARLQALAEPDSVVVAPGTHRLVGGPFDLADLGARKLKGLAAPVRAWRVLGPSTAESRFEARQATGLTPLVGREHEVGLVLDRWHVAKEGEGQVVLLQGEPGIGKSRIVRALRERLADERHTPLRYQCSPHHTSSALHPIIDQLERAAGFQRDDTAEARLAKLEALLAQGTRDVAAVVPLVADLLAVPTGGRYPPLDLTPQRRKEKLFDALLAQLEGLAAERPVLEVFEDAHWLDPTTEELLGLAVERVRTLPVLLMVTARPEFTPHWGHHAHVTSLTLNRLSRKQGATLVKRVTGKALPAEVVAQIVAKTDGVPLFVEELTKTVLELGLLREADGRYELTGPLPPLAIPSTLHDSLMARLDRLAPVKEVAQVGACIGREFSYALLMAVSALPEPALRAALDQLVASELVFGRGRPPDGSYVFKHALVRDAAHQSLLKSKRRQIHARIAAALAGHFPEHADARPELLAHHYTEAGLVERAIAYWYKAGCQALRRSAMAEAVVQLTQALELLAGLPAGPDRDRRELDLRVALGGALTVAKGYAAPEVGATYARARELCTGEVQSPQLPAALVGLWRHHLNRSSLRVALEIAEEVLHVAEQQRNTAAQAMGHNCLAMGLLFNGQLLEAMTHFEQTLTLYDPADRPTLRFLAVADPRVACLNFIPLILQWQGYPDRALVRSREGLAAAHELDHAVTLSYALHLNCWLHQVRREPRLAREHAVQQMSLATEQGFPVLSASGLFFHGWALAADGETAAGIDQMRQGLAQQHATGAHQLQVAHYLGLLAGTCTRAGSPAEALELLAEAIGYVDRTEERWFEAELHRLKGEALLALPSDHALDAEACFHKALAVARGQSARLWELRAAVSLARLWRHRGKQAEARNLLAPVYGWFSEGFDTPDLQDAKALLDELRPTSASSMA